jgi:hypothetical protein
MIDSKLQPVDASLGKNTDLGRIEHMYSHHCRCLFTGEEELEDPTGLDTPIQGSPILQLP